MNLTTASIHLKKDYVLAVGNQNGLKIFFTNSNSIFTHTKSKLGCLNVADYEFYYLNET